MNYEKLLYNKKKKIFSIDNEIYIKLKNNIPIIFLPIIRILLIVFGYNNNSNKYKLPHIIINKLCSTIDTGKIKIDFLSYGDDDYIIISDKILISDTFMILAYQYKWDINIMRLFMFNSSDDDDDYEDFNDLNTNAIPKIYFMNSNYDVIKTR